MVMGLLLAGVAAAAAGVESRGGVAAGGCEAGADADWLGGAAGVAAELEAALGLRMVSISSAVAPALLSRIISAVERSNLWSCDDLTWLTITELGTLARSISSTPWLVSTESAGGDTAALSGAAGMAAPGVAAGGADAS